MKKIIRVRRIKDKDLGSVYNLIYKTINTSYKGIYQQEAIQAFIDYCSKENLANDALTGFTIVAEYGGNMIGTGSLVNDELRRVYIDPLFQNRGVGKRVVKELEKQAELEKIKVLKLHASLVSLKFWELLGYIVEMEDYVPVGNGQRLAFYRMTKSS